ncbi:MULTISPECIES: hypothetical protein [Pseudoalteromonas]|nr:MULTISPECIES: hypothetical protein [Pseudoalteromonas]
MENMRISNTAPNIDLYTKGLASSNKSPQQLLSQKAVTASSQVNISAEGQDKLRQETSADEKQVSSLSTQESIANDKDKLGGNIIKQLNDKDAEAVSKGESTEPKTPIDELIEQKKKEIEALELQLDELVDDGSEQVAEQKKALQNQLVELNGQLLILMEEKLKLEKDN